MRISRDAHDTPPRRGFSTLVLFIVYSKEEDDCSAGQREPSLPSERAYRYHAITLGVLTVAFITTTLVTVREQKGGQ